MQKTTDVAPKKTDPSFAFTLDVREGKDVRTYYLCAASESEKKQWIDAIVTSRKYFAALKGGALQQAPAAAQESGRDNSADVRGLEKEISKLKEENMRLVEERDEMIDEMATMKLQYEQEMSDLVAKHEQELKKARTSTAGPVASGRGSSTDKKPAGRGAAARKGGFDDDDIPDFDSDDEKPAKGKGSAGGGADKELQKKLDTALAEIENLQQQLADTEETVIEQEQQIRVLKSELDEARAGGGGGGDEDVAALQEELEEAREQAADYKKKLLELRAQYKKLQASSGQ